VAVRSSALCEDTEATARAGEFDTFLFVRGAPSVVAHVRRAWAGFWNARALYARACGGEGSEQAGGGVVVQRMVASRVSGVVQTIHAAAEDPGELVVNAGLGLGEGIVSGAVGADQITVSKEGDLARGPLRFHYVVGDKAEQVVFDPSRGAGTLRRESRYHQRYRPALEYVELLDIVGTASRLETAYGHPLDIEFALEGDRVFVLQARPVPEHAALVRETLERFPLVGESTRPAREEEVR
jgi:pyruvate,water dikinase